MELENHMVVAETMQDNPLNRLDDGLCEKCHERASTMEVRFRNFGDPKLPVCADCGKELLRERKEEDWRKLLAKARPGWVTELLAQSWRENGGA